MLLMQLGIVLIVLVGVAAVSIAQSQERLKDTEGRRALAVAEGLADNAGVREAAASVDDIFSSQAQSVVQTGKQFSGSSSVMIAHRDGRVIASTDPLPRDRDVSIQLTDAMAQLIGNQPFHGFTFDGQRYDCGDKAGYIQANLALALARDDIGPVVRAFAKTLLG